MGTMGSASNGASWGSHHRMSGISRRQSQKGISTWRNSSPFDLCIVRMRTPPDSSLWMVFPLMVDSHSRTKASISVE